MNPEIIQQYKTLNWNSLLRKELGDAGRLDEAKISFDRIKEFLDIFVNTEIVTTLSQQAIYEIQGTINDFIVFTQNTILLFSDTSQKEHIIEVIRDKEFTILSNLAKYKIYLNENISEDKEDYTKKLEELKKREEEIKERFNIAEDLLEKSQKQTQTSESAKYGTAFGKQAEKHKEGAQRNFWLMIISCIITVTLAIFLLIGNQKNFNLIENLSNWEKFLRFIVDQNLLLYIIIFSLLSFLISHFSRNYSSEKNLENIYLQKQMALNSHEQILKSVHSTGTENDLETQNALLTYMSKAIFETKETGYLKGVQHNTNPTGPILDMTRK
jgi:hypothetical protein